MEAIKEKPVLGNDTNTTSATTAFTTLTFGQEWKHTGKLYVRREGERLPIYGDDAADRKMKIPHIEDDMKSKWLLGITDFGPNPILLTYKASENTLTQSRLFGAVLAKETLHHTRTDSDMKRVFNNPLDTQLRNEWMAKSEHCPAFIKLWDAYPDVYENLKTRHGEEITLRYSRGQLHIIVKSGMFTLEVQTIKH